MAVKKMMLFLAAVMMIYSAKCDDASSVCLDTEFTCVSNNVCIHKTWLCDNENDCDDGSDEKYCNLKTLPPSDGDDGEGSASLNSSGETTTQPPIVTTTMKKTTTAPTVDPACEKLVLPGCENVGYSHIRLPNVFGHSNQNQVRRSMRRWAPILQTGCSPDLNDFLCRVYAPSCKVSRLPCRSMCKKIKKECHKTLKRQKLKWPSSLRCSSLPKKRCYDGTASSTTAKPTTKKRTQQPIPKQTTTVPEYKTSSLDRCEEITIPICKGIGYNMTSFPNYFDHRTQQEADLEVRQFWPLIRIQCFAHLPLFLCSLYTPMCFFHSQARQFIPPCRSLCEGANAGCSGLMKQFGFSWPEKMQCSLFPEEDKTSLCVRAPKREVTATSMKTPPTPHSLPTDVKTPPLPSDSATDVPVVSQKPLSKIPTRTMLPTTYSSLSCGNQTTLTSPEGKITSPNYPSPYPMGAKCEWKVDLPAHEYFKVQITIDDLQLEEDRNCLYDHLVILDGLTNQVGRRHCGTYIRPYVVEVMGNQVRIVFKSDKSTSKKGFSLTYKAFEITSKDWHVVFHKVRYWDPFAYFYGCAENSQIGAMTALSLSGHGEYAPIEKTLFIPSNHDDRILKTN